MRSAATKLLLVVGSLVFLLLVLEVCLQAAALLFRMTRESGPTTIADQPAEDRVTIVCLGESTTQGFGVVSYPDILWDELRRRTYSVRFRVIGAGFVGTHSPFLAEKLEELVAQHDPQMVIVMMGINDEFYFPGDDALQLPVDLHLFLLRFRTYKLARILTFSLAERRGDRGAEAPPGAVPDEETSGFSDLVLEYARPEYWQEHPEAEHKLVSLIETVRRTSVPGEGGAITIPAHYRSHYFVAYRHLRRLYLWREEPRRAIDLYREAIRLHPREEFFYRSLAGLYADLGEADLAEQYSAAAAALASGQLHSVTRKSLKKVERLLRDRGIVFVAMQYPLRSISALKAALDGSTYPIYVDNEAPFREALLRSSYSDLFFDRFAGDMGHCTEEGNRLIAHNLIAQVFDKQFGRSRNSP